MKKSVKIMIAVLAVAVMGSFRWVISELDFG